MAGSLLSAYLPYPALKELNHVSWLTQTSVLVHDLRREHAQGLLGGCATAGIPEHVNGRSLAYMP
jgi:hypothetical protein